MDRYWHKFHGPSPGNTVAIRRNDSKEGSSGEWFQYHAMTLTLDTNTRARNRHKLTIKRKEINGYFVMNDQMLNTMASEYGTEMWEAMSDQSEMPPHIER